MGRTTKTIKQFILKNKIKYKPTTGADIATKYIEFLQLKH